MRINGKLFLIALGMASIALAVLALWLWPRFAGRGSRPVAGRIVLLLATQLSLAASVLVLINDLGGFYTSWGQLLGTASARYRLTDQGSAAVGENAGQLRLGVGPGGRGELVGLRSGLTAQIAVYLPAGYHRGPKAAALPVEVVDLTGAASQVPVPLGPAPDYQKLADSYRLLVAVVSGPSGESAIPGVNVPEGAQGELFWSQDLRQALAARYRVDAPAADWGILGAAESGTAAIDLAVQDPAHYGLAAAVGSDWTSAPAPDSWPGVDRYLSAVPSPAVRLLYDSSAPDVPSRIRSSDGPLVVVSRSGLSLTAAADWLGASIDATERVA